MILDEDEDDDNDHDDHTKADSLEATEHAFN